MKKRREDRKFCSTFRAAPIAVAVAGLLGCIGSARAFNIPSDNPDINMSWDQTVRYNAAWRVKSPNPGLANNLEVQDESNALFKKGDLVNNRIELFSEFDFKYQDRMGFRISGQAWYDDAYGSHSKSRSDPTGLANRQITGDTFNDETQRYYAGPSGEFLDHFVWINEKFGDSDVVARFGRHAIIWGVGVVGNTQAVSYSQVPNDGRKSLSSPGASAKETALPINQTTGTWQFQPNASLSWQYTFEWNPNRLALGGTYLGPDAFSQNVLLAAGVPLVTRVNAEEGEKGAWGLMYKWNPVWLGADLGLIYRKFSDTNPWAAQRSNTVPNTARYVYANDIKLWGLTFDKTIGEVDVGAEISHRENMALNSRSGGVNGGAAGRYEGPIGDTWHALLNGTMVFNQNAVWSTASLVGELQYVRLDKVTKNAGAYKSRSNPAAIVPGAGNACGVGKDEVLNSCSTNDFYNLAVIFTPTWLQVYPGLDMSLSNVYVIGLKGTAPTNGGGNESSGQYKVTLGFDYQVKHKLELSYTAFLGKHRYLNAADSGSTDPRLSGGLPIEATVGGGTFADRDYVGLTYTYNF